MRLAHSHGELQEWRAKLASGRATCPLFDTPRFVRNLERAFATIWQNHVAGRTPQAFDVVEPAK
ncbi:MAG: hypothetical protein ACM3U2_13445 [Deltaproteobacteria bacterium]